MGVIYILVGRIMAILVSLGRVKVAFAVRPKFGKVAGLIRSGDVSLGPGTLTAPSWEGRLANDSRREDVERVHLPTRPTGVRAGAGD